MLLAVLGTPKCGPLMPVRRNWRTCITESTTSLDRFGAHILLADIIGDQSLDILIGVPGESIARKLDAGGVAILPGLNGRISTGADQILYARQNEFTGKSQADAEFGTSFAVINGNLAIGAPGHSILGKRKTGIFFLIKDVIL
jgi:hypothetical protein